MKNVTAVLLSCIFVVAAACVVGVYLTDDDRDSYPSEDEDITGKWYQIYYSAYKGGEYVEGDSSEADYIAQFGFSILEQGNGLFTALYYDTIISGSCSGGHLYADGTFNGVNTFIDAVYRDGKIYASVQEIVDGYPKSLFNIYSKDPYDGYVVPEITDIIGKWTAQEAVGLSRSDSLQLLGSDLTISEQNGAVFKGKMVQMIGLEEVELDLSGSLSVNMTDERYTGYVIVNGEMWAFSVKGDSLVLVTVMIGDAGDMIGKNVAVSRAYSKDGGAGAIEVPDLTADEWFTQDTYLACCGYDGYSVNTIGRSYFDIILIVEKTLGNTFSGDMWLNGMKREMVGSFITGNSAIMFIEGPDGPEFARLDIDGDSLKLTYNLLSGKMIGTEIITLSKDIAYIDNPVGHWYCILTMTGDPGDIAVIDNNSLDQTGLYPVDIFTFSDGTIEGMYRGVMFTGSYSGGLMTFSCKLPDGTEIEAIGQSLSDYSFQIVVEEKLSDNSSSVFSSLICKEPIRASEIVHL